MNYVKASNSHTSFPLAIVVSQFNQDICQGLLQGALKRLSSYEFAEEDITVVEVPGAVEIPIVAQRLAKSKKFKAIITLGAVIRGETTHYDYVCEQVSQGCQQVALACDIPVVFGVLTTEDEQQAWDRIGGAHGHKGADAVDCALAMHQIMQQID